VVFLDNGDDRLVDQAAALARRRGTKLHLIARHRSIRPGLFGVSEARMRKGAGFRQLAEQRLVDAARLAIHRGIDVVPHAVVEDEAGALHEVTRQQPKVALVVDAGRQPAVEEAGREMGAELVVVGQQARRRAPARTLTPAFR
jgi:nucleotide-binding universal stress UspA family protein